MTHALARWSFGAIASLAVHAVALFGLLISLHPDPVPEQPLPTGELDVQAYRLDRSEARERPPPSQTADPQSPKGAAVDPGVIPQSIANEITESATPLLQPKTPAPDVAPSTSPAPTSVISSAAPKLSVAAAKPAAGKVDRINVAAESLVTLSAPGADSPALSLPATPAKPAATRPDIARAQAVAGRPLKAAAGTAAAVAPQTVRNEVAAVSRPVAKTAKQGDLPATQASFRAPDTETVKATLAFPGGADGVDPVSLAAFQSFMQPGDLAYENDPLRDGISALLGRVPCSRLQVIFNPDTVALEVRGHIPETGLREPVLSALRDRMGADITVSDNILILPRPQCGALAGIGNVGLPQSTDQITNPLLVGEDTHARVLDFVKDDRLWFDITAPDYDAFVYVDFFDAGGNVLHLVPNELTPLRLSNADAALKVGTRTADELGLGLIVGPPYGQEIAVAFAASHELYDGLRPLSEPAAPYLEWLASRVSHARDTHAEFKGEWVYFFVTTAER